MQFWHGRTGSRFSFAHLATTGVAMLVVFMVWNPTANNVDDQAGYRGIEPAETVVDASKETPTATQISLSALILNALVDDTDIKDSVEINTTNSTIEISGRLDSNQMKIWNQQVLAEYEKRGGLVSLLSQKIENR